MASKKVSKKKTTKKTSGKASGKASGKPSSKAKTASELRDSGNRIPIQLLVDYKCDGHYLFDFCRDLGTGGVFIETEKPQEHGSSLDLTFTIPDSKETLVTTGKVIWVQKAVAGRQDLVPGMGVQFEQFDSNQREVLENFVRRYHGNKYGEAAAS